MKVNAAERHCSYMQSQIIWPIKHTDDGLFIERVVEMNSYLVYLPLLKDEKGLPQAMPRGNVIFTDIELCIYLLGEQRCRFFPDLRENAQGRPQVGGSDLRCDCKDSCSSQARPSSSHSQTRYEEILDEKS